MKSRPVLTASLIAFVLLMGCILCGAPPALAAGIVVTDPITNEVGVDLNANIVATYTAAISPTTVTTQTFVAQGMMSGFISGTLGVGGGDTVVTLDPDDDYFAGEVVRVSATGGISDTGGSSVTPYQWQFTAGPVISRCAGEFTGIGAGLPEVSGGSAAWGDYDDDGDLDVLLTGVDNTGTVVTGVWRNDGGTFTDIGAALTPQVGWVSAAAWGDYDNDSDLDILFTGQNIHGVPCSRLYRNDGATFSDQTPPGLPDVWSSSVAWGDYDNDGDLDILLSGYSLSTGYTTQVWGNDGGGSFSDIGAGLPGLYTSSVAWGDYDNDGDLDIVLAGWDGSAVITQVWQNDGDGTFSDIGAGLPNVYAGTLAWGDYDNDGDLDILLTGSSIAQVWRNNGNGTFANSGIGNLVGVGSSSAAWGDYDNDGDLDILLSGNDVSSNPVAKVYRNDGGSFTDINAPLAGMKYRWVAWGDYDNDGDLDILVTADGVQYVTRVYRNEDCPELGIAKRVSPETQVDIQDVVTYTVVLSNTSTGPATGVRLTDTLPAEVDFVGWVGDAHGAGEANGVITWTGTVSGGTALTWTWQATYIGGPGRAVTNTARYGYDGAEGSDAAAFELKDRPVLVLSKEATPASGVDYHGAVTYSVVLMNVGVLDAEDVLLTDTLPAEVEFAHWVDQNGAVRDGDVITWTGAVDMGAVLTWTWQVTHTGGYGEVVTNAARATHQGSAQTVEDEATFTVKTAPGLIITKSVEPAGEVEYHGLATYSVVLANLGESDAEGVLLTDTLPAEVEFARWVEQNGAVQSDHLITWTGAVGGGAVLSWTWQVTHTGGRGDVVTNTAWYDYRGATEGYTVTVEVIERMHVISTDPTANEVGADLATDISATFDKDVDAGTVTADTFVAQGMMGGLLSGTLNTAGDTVTLDPDRTLFPGEVVRTSLTGDLQGTLSEVFSSYQWQFTAGPVLSRCAGEFIDAGAGLPGIFHSSVAWGDYDGDGDLDILFTGALSNQAYTAKVYRNDGSGSFTDVGVGLASVIVSSAAWGDYDNDGDLDILLTGRHGETIDSGITQVWRNDGGGTFTQITTSLPGVWSGSVAWGDYDNDGDLDILLTGVTGSNAITRVYRNDLGSFAIAANLPGITSGAAAWGDYDNDGDLDILLTGSGVSQVYRNDGGTFTGIGAGLPGVEQASAAWGDYDNDGDLDILLAGYTNGGVAGVWRNNGDGTFTVINAGLSGVWDCSVAWGDYDNDGDLDILLTGQDSGYNIISKVYRNEDCPELSIGKQVSPEAQVEPHDVLTYTVVLSNTGAGPATNVQMTDTLPAEMDFAGWLDDAHGATVTNDEIRWTGTVSPSTAFTWTWTVTFAGAFDPVDNTAWYNHSIAGLGSATATFSLASKFYFLPAIYKQSH